MTVEGKQFVRDGPRFSKKQSKQGFRQPFGQQGFGGPFGGSDRGTTSASSSPSGISLVILFAGIVTTLFSISINGKTRTMIFPK